MNEERKAERSFHYRGKAIHNCRFLLFVYQILVTIYVTKIAKTLINREPAYSVSSLQNSYILENGVGEFTGEFTLVGIGAQKWKNSNFE